MYKKLIMFLNEMMFDLSTREFFPIFKIWKNESALPIAPAPANSTKAASEASLQFCRAKIASGVQFCFGHKSLWYPELPSNDVATKLQLTLFRLTWRLGAFLGFQAAWNSARTTKKATTRNRGDKRRIIWFLLLLFLQFLLLLKRKPSSRCKCRELHAVQRRQQETSRRFCETLWILNFALSAICSSNATNELN